MGLRLILLAIAFVAVANILSLEVLRGAWVLSTALQALPVSPAASGRIVLAAFRGDLANIAIF